MAEELPHLEGPAAPEIQSLGSSGGGWRRVGRRAPVWAHAAPPAAAALPRLSGSCAWPAGAGLAAGGAVTLERAPPRPSPSCPGAAGRCSALTVVCTPAGRPWARCRPCCTCMVRRGLPEGPGAGWGRAWTRRPARRHGSGIGRGPTAHHPCCSRSLPSKLDCLGARRSLPGHELTGLWLMECANGGGRPPRRTWPARHGRQFMRGARRALIRGPRLTDRHSRVDRANQHPRLGPGQRAR